MSTLKSINVQHPSATTINIVNDSSGNVTVGNNLTVTGNTTTSGNETVTGTLVMGSSFKRNRIINGNMLIDQRNAGASVTPADNAYTLDRWRFFLSQASKLTTQQNQGSVTPPAGFAKYLGITSSSAYTVGSSERFSLMTSFESSNVSDFAWGTASALPVTLSFWARSSLTGTFGGAVRNWAYTYSYPFSYTINSANTWTYITVSITAPTAGTWVMDGSNGGAIEVLFNLGAGSTYSGTAGAWASANYTSATGATSVVGTSGATFYITGVQLEVGTKATPYEMQIYSDQLAQCQRYYWKSAQDGYSATHKMMLPYTGSTARFLTMLFPVQMRTNPTISGTVSAGTFADYGTNRNVFGCQGSGLANDAANCDASALTASAEL